MSGPRPCTLYARIRRERVGANFLSLASTCGESSLITLPLLSPQSLKAGFAGTLWAGRNDPDCLLLFCAKTDIMNGFRPGPEPI